MKKEAKVGEREEDGNININKKKASSDNNRGEE